MSRVLRIMCVLLLLDNGSQLTSASTTLTGRIKFNLSTKSTTNQVTPFEMSTMYSNVTLNKSMSSEPTFMVRNDTLINTIIYGCSFQIIDVGIKQQVQSFVAESKELIFLHFYLSNQTAAIQNGPNDTIYDILTIVRAAGGFGNELLAMHPQFEQFSIGTLMFGVEHVHIPLQILPIKCLKQWELQQTLLKIGKQELGLLEKKKDGTLAHLCQVHAEDVSGLASFYYNCCTVENNGKFVCNRLETNKWMTVLLVGMNIGNVIVFLYSPLLIPTSWYKASINAITLRTERIFKLKLCEDLYKAKPLKTKIEMVNILSCEKDSHLKVKGIKLKILEMNTVSTDYVPAGIFHYLYRTFIKCHVKDHEYVTDCCHTDICNVQYCKKEAGKRLVWHKCLQPLMQHIFLLCLLIPWVVRILFFYVFESEDRNNRETFARNINLEYPNILQWSLTYSLKPNHLFFICVYGFICFVPLSKIFIKRAMQESNINDNKKFSTESKKLVQLLVIPCRKQGLIGCLISPIYIMIISPLVIIRFILTYIPIFKVSWTLLCGIANAFRNMVNEKWRTRKCIDSLLLLLRSVCLLMIFMAIGSSMFICLEVVIFFLQIGMYFTIGILLNASSVLTYVTFGGMLLFYVYDTLRNVKKKYEAFSQAVIEFSVSDMQKQVIKTFKEKKDIKCSAFQFKLSKESSNKSHFDIEFDDTRNRVLLISKYPCLFFDENSKPYFNEKAFFRMCCMKVLRAPGSLWENYKKAAVNFLLIFCFLIFVVIIVLAFGKSHGIPGTYQAIATIGGGLVPLILRRYLFKSEDVFDFKSDHFLLFEEMEQLFENYCETWEIVALLGSIKPDSSDICELKYETILINKFQSKPNFISTKL